VPRPKVVAIIVQGGGADEAFLHTFIQMTNRVIYAQHKILLFLFIYILNFSVEFLKSANPETK
jgi:hypothetical protein